jgi:ABC-type branched-subunit amino acid transport system substrate-binding protein
LHARPPDVRIPCGPDASAASTASAPSSVAPCIPPKTATPAELDSRIGITANSVTVGNVSIKSGPIPGLFAGAPIGVRAYFAYVDAHGGVDGRTLKLTSYDDGFSAAQNRIETAQAVANHFALVGSFSVFDSTGCTVLARAPAMPDVSASLDPATRAPNDFSVYPTNVGW